MKTKTKIVILLVALAISLLVGLVMWRKKKDEINTGDGGREFIKP